MSDYRTAGYNAPADEIQRLNEHLAERTLQHQTQLDNAVRLTARLAAAEAELIWTCGCGIVNGVNLSTCRACGRREDEWRAR